MVEVGKAHRACDCCHAPLFPPFYRSVKQGVDNLVVVDEFDETETHVFFAGTFVDLAVDDGGYASDRSVVAVGHE